MPEAPMANVEIGTQEAMEVNGLLREIADGVRAAPRLQSTAAYWAGCMDQTMDRSDLKKVALVLMEASGERAMSRAQRRTARWWAGWLRARA
jgi:hypothetical protein